MIKARNYAYPARTRRIKAMTIGLGFQCQDGVVLCSDRQITKDGGLKYHQRKDFCVYFRGNVEVNCAAVYAGYPDAASILFEDSAYAIRELLMRPLRGFHADVVKTVLGKIFKGNRHSKNLEMLIAVGPSNQANWSPFLIKTHGSRVVRGFREFIGVGDSSVIRYLSEIFSGALTVPEAEFVGTYMVSLANRFIDGCGGGPDVLVLHKDGKVEPMEAEKISGFGNRLQASESCIGDFLLKKGEYA